jgi:hypothetical protein
VNIDHVTRSRDDHPQRLSWRANGLGSFDLDLDDEIHPVLSRALEDLTDDAVDGENGIVSGGGRRVLCPGAIGLAREEARDDKRCDPHSGSNHGVLLLNEDQDGGPAK